MPCDSLRLLDYDLARFIQSLTAEETVAFYKSKKRSGALRPASAGAPNTTDLDAELQSREEAKGRTFIPELKGELVWRLCLLGDDVPYPNPPLDAIDSEEWSRLETYGDITGDLAECLFQVLTWKLAESLLDAFVANASSNRFYNESRVRDLRALIKACKQKESLRIAYMNDY